MQKSSLGAHPIDGGTRFSLRSEVAESVELCVFDDEGVERSHRMEGEGLFVAEVEVGFGTRYGFRVHGPWDPVRGQLCNPSKLLLDPYAFRLDGAVTEVAKLRSSRADDPSAPSPVDSAAATMRSVVVDRRFDWEGDRPPSVTLADSVIYETHVRGISMTHPEIPPSIRGTYAGLAHPATVGHLVGLGVTAVELLPIHAFVDDVHLIGTGRHNYWGYNSIGFFAPHHGYAATGDPVVEFKQMVKALHQAGIEVILDVVYNHTGEGDNLGPTLSFRGIDNRAWYRLDEDGSYLNWTGTGNTVDFSSPVVLRTVLDSLRYWVEEMHVDGFRFDLATTLGRTRGDFDALGGFFGAIVAEPILDGTKLIAEPWDIGPGGYQAGRFPPGWSEWNDSYRDSVREFWRGSEGAVTGFAQSLTGSRERFGRGRRQASINYVTSHDGFTLRDLVSYNERHNHANGEDNRDGHHHNRSWNSGHEGETTDPAVLALRARRSRAMLATTMVSRGVPMILGGDETGRTQRGNNNAYNQDDQLSWYDWSAVDVSMVALVSELIGIRREHPSLRGPWSEDQDDVRWFRDDGRPMTDVEWHDRSVRFVQFLLGGEAEHLLVVCNAASEPATFARPEPDTWELVMDTAPGERPLDLAADFSLKLFVRLVD